MTVMYYLHHEAINKLLAQNYGRTQNEVIYVIFFTNKHEFYKIIMIIK